MNRVKGNWILGGVEIRDIRVSESSLELGFWGKEIGSFSFVSVKEFWAERIGFSLIGPIDRMISFNVRSIFWLELEG